VDLLSSHFNQRVKYDIIHYQEVSTSYLHPESTGEFRWRLENHPKTQIETYPRSCGG
jgi:hypothetical protein